MAIEGEAIEAYLDGLMPPRDQVLQSMEAFAEEWDVPIVGPRVGTLLMILAAQTHASRILELGTAIGYSAIWLARGMAAGGRVVTIEAREEMAQRARENLRRAGLLDVVDVRVGMAVDVLLDLKGSYDVIFNDIDKEGYPQVLPRLKAILRPGGLLITDNVLWSGRVADPGDSSASTVAIREYNKLLARDEDMETVIVPLRDGVSISRKKE